MYSFHCSGVKSPVLQNGAKLTARPFTPSPRHQTQTNKNSAITRRIRVTLSSSTSTSIFTDESELSQYTDFEADVSFDTSSPLSGSLTGPLRDSDDRLRQPSNLSDVPNAMIKTAGRAVPDGFTYQLFRWPLLLLIFVVVLLELVAYTLIRQFVRLQEYVSTSHRTKFPLRSLKEAADYEEYVERAKEMDKAVGYERWKEVTETPYYDFRLISRVNRLMSRYRHVLAMVESDTDGAAKLETGDSETSAAVKLKRVLLDGPLKTNLAGIENISLYSRTYYGTKQTIEQYVSELTLSIQAIYDCKALDDIEKLRFFKHAVKMYGRSALCLSGGATFGYYHLGVVKALLEQDCLPAVITGTSAGSLVAAFVCTRTDEELRRELTPELHKIFTACDQTWLQMAKRFWKTGALFDPEIWIPKLHVVTNGSLTFLEAYQRTGRILNITVISEHEHAPPKLINYLTGPDIVISSAVLASSAIPGLLPPIELKRKSSDGSIVTYAEEGRFWRDGSLRIDIPLSELHKMFQVNYTIVSQVNPHIILFFYNYTGSGGRPTLHRSGRGWRGGFLLSSLELILKGDLKKWLRVVRDLQLMPRIFSQNVSFVWLQKFEGQITILPEVSFSDYYHILTDPNLERMDRYIRLGMRNTWPTLHMIENRFGIERLIYRLREELNEKVGP